jgi:hypothetical protein
MSLDVNERRAYVGLLGQRIDAENRAFEELSERWERG